MGINWQGATHTGMIPMKLYAHPFSSYSQKVLIALYENDVPFDYLNLEAATVKDELASL